MQNPVATKRLTAIRVDRGRVGADEQQALRGEKLGAVFCQADEIAFKTILPALAGARAEQDSFHTLPIQAREVRRGDAPLFRGHGNYARLPQAELQRNAADVMPRIIEVIGRVEVRACMYAHRDSGDIARITLLNPH